MDEPTERFLRDAYAAFLARDFEALRETLAPDAIYVNPPYAIDGGTRQGADRLVEMWREVHDLFELQSMEIEALEEGPRGIFALLRFRAYGRTSRVPTEVVQAQLVRLRGGLISELHWFMTPEEGLEAAGLAP
ncbi:MAG: nuclear transport factor 2 family protein [Thermoleophilaceae bacterium]